MIAGLPPYLTLDDKFIVRLTAQSPTTGALVAGVIVSNTSLAIDDVSGTGAIGLAPFPQLVPAS